jgi:hypothetical protein
VHGHQQLSLFNAHYDERCFLPIHIYEATMAMILREGKTPSGEKVRTVSSNPPTRANQIRTSMCPGKTQQLRAAPLKRQVSAAA